MNGNGEAEVRAGVMPPMDDVVKWRENEIEDFAEYHAEHRPIFFDQVKRACRSNHAAAHVVVAIMPWIRVLVDHERTLRGLSSHDTDQNGLNDEAVGEIAALTKRIDALEAAAAKPKGKRGRPPGSKNKPATTDVTETPADGTSA